MSSNPPRTKSVRIRHRIKEIELQPIRSTSKYPISVKVFIDDKEVCQLPPIERGQDLRWSRPIVCRDISPQSKVTLEICEIHTIIDRSFKSKPYVISEVQDQVETTVGFAGTEWIAKVTMLTPKTAEQSHAEALRQLKETELAPSALEKLGTAQKVLSAVLDFGNAVADAHPAAKLVFSISTVVWEKLKEEDQLKGDTQGLLHGLTDIAELCEPVKKTTKMKQLKSIIDDILILLEDAFIYVLEHESSGSGGPMRALRRVFDSSGQETVEELLGRYKRLRKQFNSGVGVDIHGAVHKLDLQSLLDKLQPVSSAGYNLDQACQHGTREEIIADIMDWTERPPSATPKPERMLWIHGQAGIGKSAIASSVCGKLKDTRTLAASFFCKRDGGSDLHDPLRLINTIAHSLANRCPDYAEAVAAAIEGNRELCMTNTLHERYEGLIDKPLQELRDLAEPRPLIVVVDALDEFGTIERQEELVEYLSAMSQLVPWLKVIVTSRPEGHIAECFQRQEYNHVSSRNLHDFDASDDIRAYFQKELDKLAGRRGWKWPEGTVERLSEKAYGLFIWASTVKRYIEGSAGLKIAIERLNTVLEGQSKHRDLDKLYEQVIEAGMRDTDDDNRAAFCQCIGMIIAVSTRRPLSLPALSSLLDGYVDPEIMDNVVNSLGAVIHVDRQMGDALRFYHQSFVDYATDRSRANSFYVDLGKRNVELAEACLKVMEGELKFNICGLGTSHLFNSQVLDLHERVESKISSRLNYSCVYWISHLTDTPKGTLSNELDTLLIGPQALFWLEVLSLLGRVGVGVAGLLDLLDWLPSELKSMRECVIDLSRFTSAFYEAISASTPHLYVSALALAPESALVAQRLRSSFPNTLVTNGGDKNWPDWLRIADHPSVVQSVAVSPDGRRLATSCGDGIVRLWDMRTGLKVGKPLVGHSRVVMCVDFSPKGDLIISGAWDNTVRMWDAKACTAIGEPLVGHSDCVNSVACSPNCDLIASGSADKTVRVWDVKKCAAISEPLAGHSADVIFVAFSPDGNRIISGSSANEVLIWDAETLAVIRELLVGDRDPGSNIMTSLALSPNGDLIASGSIDSMLRIWNAKTGAPIGEPLEGHSDYVASIAFSPNSDFIVSGSRDKTVRIWDVKTGAAIGQPLVGHSLTVCTLAVSLEGDIIISGSLDRTARMWDAKKRTSTGEPLATHSYIIQSVTFSPNGELIASASSDNTVRMWDANTCAATGEPLVGHSDVINSVAFSPNNDLIISGSDDGTVQVWDVQTRAAVGEPLVGHSDCVTSVAFSPSGDLIISGSHDKTVRMWDIKTHASTSEPLVGHSDTVSSVAFSPNGSLIVSGSWDYTVRLWDAETCEAIGAPLIGHSDCVTSVVFSPGNDLVVSGSEDKTVRIWGVQSRSAIGEPLVGHNVVMSVAFCPDGSLIASASADFTVQIWDVATRVPINEPLAGHLNCVQCVAFSPDGNLIVSGSQDGTLRVWDPKIQTPDCNETLRSPWPLSLLGLPPLSGHAGWTSLDNDSLLLWLPSHYFRPYDPRALHYISADATHSPILLDFSKFVHGTDWTWIASESFLREYM